MFAKDTWAQTLVHDMLLIKSENVCVCVCVLGGGGGGGGLSHSVYIIEVITSCQMSQS